LTKHEDWPYVEHILEAIRDIEESVKGLSMKEFINNKDIRDANIRRLEIIGEAVKNISQHLKNENKEIEWNKIAGMRDKVIHNYFGVNLEIVWNVIKADLPDLKVKINKIKRV